MTYLYVIIGPGGKAYVGITNNPRERWRQHRKCKREHPLYRSMAKHGRDNFSMEIISEHTDLALAKRAEISLIAMLNSQDRNSGYNISPGGDYDALSGPIALREKLKNDKEYSQAFSLRTSNSSKTIWANRSEQEKEQIFSRIAETLKTRCTTDPEFGELQRERMLAARAKGDVRKRAAAASAGIKKWWDDLRADPERYAEYISRRRASLMKTLGLES